MEKLLRFLVGLFLITGIDMLRIDGDANYDYIVDTGSTNQANNIAKKPFDHINHRIPWYKTTRPPLRYQPNPSFRHYPVRPAHPVRTTKASYISASTVRLSGSWWNPGKPSNSPQQTGHSPVESNTRTRSNFNAWVTPYPQRRLNPIYRPESHRGLLRAPDDIDFCSLRCGKNHIACKDNGFEPDPHCPVNPEYNDMEEFKEQILEFHNTLRNEVASGHAPNFPPATRMATMQWNDVLHYLASLKAQLCQVEHDHCHGTPEFITSGQNVGLMYYHGVAESKPLGEIIDGMLRKWENGSTMVTSETLLSFPNLEQDEERMKAAFFSILIREENTHVGCGINRFERVHGHVEVIFICNYATDNLIETPTYKQGPTASECNMGINPRYPALCNVGERYFHGVLFK